MKLCGGPRDGRDMEISGHTLVIPEMMAKARFHGPDSDVFAPSWDNCIRSHEYKAVGDRLVYTGYEETPMFPSENITGVTDPRRDLPEWQTRRGTAEDWEKAHAGEAGERYRR